MEELTSAKDIIERLGGFTAVGQLTSRKYTAVFNWRAINKFPANTFTLIQEELHKSGYTAPDSLWGMLNAPDPQRTPLVSVSPPAPIPPTVAVTLPGDSDGESARPINPSIPDTPDRAALSTIPTDDPYNSLPSFLKRAGKVLP